MTPRASHQSRYLPGLLRLALPTLFVWLLAFEWIARANPGFQITIRVVLILFALIWIVLQLRTSKPLYLGPTGVLFLFFVVLSALQVPSAPLPFHSLEVTLRYAFFFFTFLFFLNEVESEESHRAWMFAFLQAAIIFSLFNLLFILRWWMGWFEISGPGLMLPPFGYRLPGVFLHHPNVEAAYLNLVLPFLLVGFLQTTKWIHRAGIAILLILFICVSFFASSRGAWLATASILGTILILHYWDRIVDIYKQFKDQRRLHLSSRSLLWFALGGLIVTGMGVLSYLQARFGGHGGRWALWAIAWEIFTDAPLLGHGAGSFHVLGAVKAQIPPGFYLVHAHNLVLQLLDEHGVIGLGLFTWIGFVSTRYIIQAWHKPDPRISQQIGHIALLVGMLIHQMVDFAFESPLYTVAVIYALASITQNERSTSLSLSRPALRSVLLFSLLLLYLLGSIIGFQGDRAVYEGVQAARRGEWSQAQELLCSATRDNPWNSMYQFQCGFSSAVTAEIEREPDLLTSASSAYATGLDLDPHWAYHHASYAATLWSQQDAEGALAAMIAAQEMAPRSAIIALNLAYYHDYLGQESSAELQLKQAFTLNPWLWLTVRDPWNPAGEPLDKQNLNELEKRLSASVVEAWKGWIHIQQDQYGQAESSFLAALSHDPLQVEAMAGLAYLTNLEGNFEKASEWLSLASLTGRKSWLLSEVQGIHAESLGEEETAITFWLEGARLFLWPTSLSPYYESVYSRAYIPIDLPPQVIQPSLPAAIENGLRDAIQVDSGRLQIEVRFLQPWVEQQIHLLDKHSP